MFIRMFLCVHTHTHTHTHPFSGCRSCVLLFFNFSCSTGGAEGGASSGDVTDSRGASANSDFCSERGSERGEWVIECSNIRPREWPRSLEASGECWERGHASFKPHTPHKLHSNYTRLVQTYLNEFAENARSLIQHVLILVNDGGRGEVRVGVRSWLSLNSALIEP